MLEVHDLPSCIPVPATYYPYVGNIKQAGQDLERIVFYEKKGMLEGGMLGISYNVQISASILPDIPKHNDVLEINGKQYKIINPQIKESIVFYKFFQMEVKSVV